MVSPDKRQTQKNRHFGQAFYHAIVGIGTVIKNERNMRSHLVSATFVVVAGFILHVNLNAWCWLTLAIALVWFAEFLNTVIEAIVNLIVGEKFDPNAKIAKDVAAGLVLLAAGLAVIIGLLVLTPYLIKFLK
ncbi:MAG TPA: diacylglycerol kinase family protein [Candidatus Limosilactobacillus faecipullorum]|nr:diacylglycerol kinase family protein [Candidatus Limosilactobacillus faecipullorum]